MWDQGRRLKERTVDLCGIDFTVQQRAAMETLWAQFELLASRQDHHISIQVPQDVNEAVAQLFILFWTETPNDANLERTAIARFSGVLSIHPDHSSR